MSEKTQLVKLSSLTPDNRNANAGTERGTYMLDYSLRNLGAGRSILIDKEGRIIAGNKTAEAAGAIGLDDVIIVETDGTKLVAVKRTDLDLTTDEEARLMAHADNRVSEVGFSLDLEELQIDIGEGLDLSGLFTDFELDEMFPSDEEKSDPGAQVDKAEVLLEKWGVQRGQIWTAGRHRIMCGDSTSAEDVGRLMGGEKAGLVWTDPPYATFASSTGKLEIDDFEMLRPFFALIFKAIVENLQPGRAAFVCTDWRTYPVLFQDSARFLSPKNLVVWYHGAPKLGANFRPCYELMLYMLHTRGKNWKNSGATGWKILDRGIKDVWEIKQSESAPGIHRQHASQKPIELVSFAIKHCSDKGNIVLDLFNGSGTTLVACEQTNRTGYGMEIAEKYVSVTLERLTDMGLNCALLG